MAVEMFAWLDNLVHGKHSQQELHDPDKPLKPLLHHHWLGCGHCDKEATHRFCDACYAKLIILNRASIPSCVGAGRGACSDECAKVTTDLVAAAMRPRIEREGEGD